MRSDTSASQPAMTMFRRAAVVGVGLMGGSLGLALKRRGLAGEVVGVSRRQQTLDRAVELGAVDRGGRDLSLVGGADLVVLAAPVRIILGHLGLLAGHLSPGALVTDLGSTKREIVQAAQRHGLENFVGGHPMAGSHRSGVEAARAELYQRAVWAITPTENTPAAAVEKLTGLVKALGARPLVISPDQHDRLVALVSHLPHLASVALVNLAGKAAAEQPALKSLAATGFRDMTRLAGGQAELWRDVSLSNADYLCDCLDRLAAELAGLRELVRRGDGEALLAELERARQAREELRS